MPLFDRRVIAVLFVLALATSAGAQNATQLENMKAGSPDWQAGATAQNREIEGYASATSVNRGEQIKLYVSTSEPQYTIDVYRMGWYDGIGARKLLGPITRTGVKQPMPSPDASTGLIECNWTDPYVLSIPASADHTDWASGVYLAKLVSSATRSRSYIVFVVRDDSRASTHNFQTSVTTYEAYNNWGGRSLYAFNSTGGQAVKVSFNRPYASGNGTGDFLYGWEYNMLRFMEREGYDVTYSTNIDTHLSPVLLKQHRDFLSIGHDEYWSADMRTNVTAARDAGVHLGFFSADVCYWQIRLEPSTIDTTQADRTIVGYKESYKSDPYFTDHDPKNDKYVTTLWRDPPVNQSEDGLLGVRYVGSPVNGDVVIDDVTSKPWVFENTGLTSGSHLFGLLGYEVDGMGPATPAGTVRLGHSPFTTTSSPPTSGFADMTLYTAASNALVFATGTIQWSWGLDTWNSGQHGDRTQNGAQQITRNVLRKFAGDAASKDCQYLISPDSENVEAAGKSDTFTIESQCDWTVTSDVAWIGGFSNTSGSRTAQLSYVVSANLGPARIGHVHVGDRTLTIAQDSGCTFTLNPQSASYAASGGNGSFTVATSDARCSWSATPLKSWIAIVSVNGDTVSYSVAANTGAARTGGIDVAGTKFTITQSNGCTYSVSPQSFAFGGNGGTGTVNVNTDATCFWKATVSSSYPWIAVATTADQKGPGRMQFTAASNGTNTARRGHLAVAGADITVDEGAALPAAVSSIDAHATGEKQITVTWGASPNATSYQIDRSASGTNFSPAGTSTTTTFVDTVTPGAAYLYRVRAINASGSSAYSNADLAVAAQFTDDPIVPGVTTIKALHITEVRDSVNAVRSLAQLGPIALDAAPGMPATAANITQLRNAIDEALRRLPLPVPAYANDVGRNSIIRAVDLQELRDRVR